MSDAIKYVYCDILLFCLSLLLIELKIHVSPDTKAILDTFHTFQLELRGPVEMKVCVTMH